MIQPGTAERFWKSVRQHIAEYAAEYLPHVVPVEVTEVDATTGWVKVKFLGRDTAAGGFMPVLSSEATLQVGDIPYALAVGTNVLVLGNTANTPFTGGGGGASSLNGLTDVDTATDPPVTGEALKYNGSLWVPQPDSGVTDHGALTGLADDDHPQYQKESEKGSANGYASLGAGGLVPMSQLATGTPDGTKFVRDDGTLATPAGGGFEAAYAYVSADASSTQNLSSSTWTKINLATENADPDSCYDSSTSTITIPRTGKYLFLAGIHFPGSELGAGDSILLGIKINAAGQPAEYMAGPHAAGTAQIAITGSAMYAMTAGDTVQLYAWQNTGAIATTSVRNYLRMVYIGD